MVHLILHKIYLTVCVYRIPYTNKATIMNIITAITTYNYIKLNLIYF